MRHVDSRVSEPGPPQVDPNRLPTFLIIGAPKAATSSLHYYLSLHPEVSVSTLKKETNFFVPEDYLAALPVYAASFDPSKPARGEASPHYATFPTITGVPERIHALVPDVKLVYLVRDPIDRAEAYFHELRTSNKGPRSITDAFADPERIDNLCVAPSRYGLQLQQFLEYFPQSNILVIDSDDLRAERRATLKTIFSFIGVDDQFSSPRFDEELNTAAGKRRMTTAGRRAKHSAVAKAMRRTLPLQVRAPLFAPARRALSREEPRIRLSDEARARVADALRDDVATFRALTGRAFERWTV